jgi:hypothetical protein
VTRAVWIEQCLARRNSRSCWQTRGAATRAACCWPARRGELQARRGELQVEARRDKLQVDKSCRRLMSSRVGTSRVGASRVGATRRETSGCEARRAEASRCDKMHGDTSRVASRRGDARMKFDAMRAREKTSRGWRVSSLLMKIKSFGAGAGLALLSRRECWGWSRIAVSS